jgi:hypothetical protein
VTINLLTVLAGIMCLSIGGSDVRNSVGDWDLYMACLWVSAGIMLVRGSIETEDPR